MPTGKWDIIKKTEGLRQLLEARAHRFRQRAQPGLKTILYILDLHTAWKYHALEGRLAI